LHQKAYLSFALPKMYITESRTNLNLLGYEMRVPFFIVDGREDRLTPPQLTQFYFQEVNAPRKAMIVIDNAGHFVAMSNADAFLRILVEKVRPLSAQRS